MVSLLKATAEDFQEARGWLWDIGMPREYVEKQSEDVVRRHVNRQYDGGWESFLRDVQPVERYRVNLDKPGQASFRALRARQQEERDVRDWGKRFLRLLNGDPIDYTKH